MMSQGLMYVYIYKKSLDNKHQGAILKHSALTAMLFVAKNVKDVDVVEIMICDSDDNATFHWKAVEGLIFPTEAEGVLSFVTTSGLWRARPERL